MDAQAVDGEVQMTIGNTGDGIPKHRSGQLFERFYRVRGGGRVPGHGLGLSIARELARAHGGDVETGPFRGELDRNASAPAESCLTTEVVQHGTALISLR